MEEIKDITSSDDTDNQIDGKLNQEQVDKIIQQRLERAEKKFAAEKNELVSKLSTYEQERENQKLAEMSEVEKAKAEVERYKNQVKEFETSLKQMQIQTLKEGLVNQKAPMMPKAYRALISGENEDEISESIAVIKTQMDEDFKSLGITPTKNIGSATHAEAEIASPDAVFQGNFDTPISEYIKKVTSKK